MDADKLGKLEKLIGNGPMLAYLKFGCLLLTWKMRVKDKKNPEDNEPVEGDEIDPTPLDANEIDGLLRMTKRAMHSGHYVKFCSTLLNGVTVCSQCGYGIPSQ